MSHPKPYTVRTSWEGSSLNETSYTYIDDAERDFDDRVKFLLNLPDTSLAKGTVVQLIEGDRVHAEHVAA